MAIDVQPKGCTCGGDTTPRMLIASGLLLAAACGAGDGPGSGKTSCQTFLDCADDERCDGTAAEQAAGDGVCVVLENPCDNDGGCADGLVCNVVDCRRVCEPPGERGTTCHAAGDELACEGALQQSSPVERACAEGLVCEVISFGFSADGECVPPSDRALFENCQSSEACAEGLACELENFLQCRTSDGGACADDVECASGACVDGSCAG